MEKTRAFIAIDFPNEVVKEIARVQSVLETRKFTGKITEIENLHLTLKFLGEIDETKVKEVKEKLKEVKLEKFEARLVETGIFKHRGVPSIVWIKVGGKGIFELQAKIDGVMTACGFVPEKRFMSHTTIARIKYVKEKKKFVEYVNGMGVKEVKWGVGSFKLMSSELKSLGPTYKCIEEYVAKE